MNNFSRMIQPLILKIAQICHEISDNNC